MSLTKASYSMINGAPANVFDFGATGDGVTDDTAAFQNALNSGATIVEVPVCSNFYRVTSPIKIPFGVALRGKQNTAMVGTSVQTGTPRITKTTNTTVGITTFDTSTVVQRDCIFYLDPVFNGIYYPQNFEISGLSITGNASTLVSFGIYFEQGSNLIVKDCDIFNVQNGFYGRNVFISTFQNVKFSSKFQVTDGGTSLVLSNCSMNGSSTGYDGYNFFAVQYSSLISCTADNCVNTAFAFQNCSGISLIGCGSETSTYSSVTNGWAISFNGGNTAFVSGFFTNPTSSSTTPIFSTNQFDNIKFQSCYLAQNKAAVPSMKDVYLTASSKVTFDNSVFTNVSSPDYSTPSLTFTTTTGVAVVNWANNSKVITSTYSQNSVLEDGMVIGDTANVSNARFYGKSSTAYTGATFRSDSSTATGTGWFHLLGTSSNNTVPSIYIYGNGDVFNANNVYAGISDEILKENIIDATPKLNDLSKVKIRNYNLKSDESKQKQIGVIAQELEAIFPNMVETDEKGIKGVKYSIFVPMLIKAIQELKAEVDLIKVALDEPKV